MSERITQAELARRLGVSRAAVSAAVKVGRIHPGEDGLLDSVTAIHEWRESTRRTDDAHNRKRGGQPKYASARARKENALADLAELKRAQLLGNLVEREDMEAAMKFIGGAMRAAIDAMPDQTAPLIAPISDIDAVCAILEDAGRAVLDRVGDAIARQRRELDRMKDKGRNMPESVEIE